MEPDQRLGVLTYWPLQKTMSLAETRRAQRKRKYPKMTKITQTNSRKINSFAKKTKSKKSCRLGTPTKEKIGFRGKFFHVRNDVVNTPALQP